MTAHASIQFEREARLWDDAGRPDPVSPPAYHTLALRCWTGSRGGKHDGVSDRLAAYLAALQAALARSNPDWFDDLLNEKDSCDSCGESWRVENVSLCTGCSYTFPPCHRPRGQTLPNGNEECPRCHGGEIVG